MKLEKKDRKKKERIPKIDSKLICSYNKTEIGGKKLHP